MCAARMGTAPCRLLPPHHRLTAFSPRTSAASMFHLIPQFAVLWLALVLWGGFVQREAIGADAAPTPVDFVKDVQPLLKQRCWRCHGGDHQEGGLRLNEKKSAFAGGDSGKPAIVPG